MERKEMEFGRKFRAGNFEYVKIMKTMPRKELIALRDSEGIPKDVRKHLQRGGLPYIVVSAVSGVWSISFSCAAVMYTYIESAHFEEDGEKSLNTLFTMMYSDTCVFGDQQYWQDKADALNAYMKRQRKEVSKEDDDKEVEALKAEHDALENLKEMVREGGEDA